MSSDPGAHRRSIARTFANDTTPCDVRGVWRVRYAAFASCGSESTVRGAGAPFFPRIFTSIDGGVFAS
jgi:hypothetical protein